MRHTQRFTLLTSLLLMSLLWSAVPTAATPADVEAEVTLATAQAADLAGRQIRCRAPADGRRTVGIHLTAARVRLRHAHIDGCDIGVLVAQTAASSTVTHVTITRVSVGIWMGGVGGLADSNIVGETDVGIVLSGHNTTVRRNWIMDSRLDGLLVLGDRNLIEANRIERSAGIGLYAAATVPLHSDWEGLREILELKDVASGNTIRANVLLSNGLDLADQTEPCRRPPGGINVETQNTWENNSFASKWPDCLQ